MVYGYFIFLRILNKEQEKIFPIQIQQKAFDLKNNLVNRTLYLYDYEVMRCKKCLRKWNLF